MKQASNVTLPVIVGIALKFVKLRLLVSYPSRTQAMQFNHSVRHLDFSDNAIGGGYEKTQRLPGGPTTGGASISLALGVNSTLRRIDLQWNLLGSKV